MKQLLTILCLVLLVSCSNKVPSDKLVERDGITYEVNSTTPFTGRSVGYHDNDQISSKAIYKDGKRDGLYKLFYDNGRLKEKGNYKNGEGKVDQYQRSSTLAGAAHIYIPNTFLNRYR